MTSEKNKKMAVSGDVVDYNRAKDQREFDEAKIGVKGLVDSGITAIPRFFMHPSQTLPAITPTTTASRPNTAQVPVIDLSGVISTSANHRAEVVHQIREASRTWGVFYVTNHGIPTAVLDETIAAAKSFHEQPKENKAQHYTNGDLGCDVVLNTNFNLILSKASTWKDTLEITLAPNPPKLDRIPAVCRKEVVIWEEHMNQLGETLMELLSEGLGAAPRRLKELTCMDYQLLLAHYYPYCPQPDLTMGIQSHSDFSTITVLLQNHIGGLQVKQGQEWVDVKPISGALLVFIGDLLQIISNDGFKSCEHRVLANCFREPRVTIPFFFKAHGDSIHYGPMPELLSPENPAVYRNFTMKEFVEAHYDALVGNWKTVSTFKL